ncbi:hypothetical protein GCM10011325_44410 [Dyadobacter sediminis]|nr:hypothetical protein GCM10011325_44410 [Dyadobacter sediminis]
MAVNLISKNLDKLYDDDQVTLDFSRPEKPTGKPIHKIFKQQIMICPVADEPLKNRIFQWLV